MTSLLKLTKDLLKAEGWTFDDTERVIPHTRIKKDLFGFADLLAIKTPTILAVQVTEASHHSTRRKKILSLPTARLWLTCDAGQIELISWSNRGGKWTPRREQIGLADFLQAAPLERP